MYRFLTVILSISLIAPSISNATKKSNTHKSKTTPSSQTQTTLISGNLTGEARDKAAKEFEDKYKNKKKYKLSYYKIYNTYVPKLGVKHIGAYLEKINPSCHGVGHALGKVVGETVSELNAGMQACGNICTYACVHGVYKVYFTKLGKSYHNHKPGHHQSSTPIKLSKRELRKFSRDVNRACKSSRSVVSDFFRGNCAHGVGHAMGKITQDIRLATNYCKEFPGKAMRYYCESGVFMELAHGVRRILFKGTTRRSERLSLALNFCDKKSNYPTACLRFLLSQNKNLGQIARFSSLCSKQRAFLKKHCYDAMGFFSMNYIARYPRELQFACSLSGRKTDQKACIFGATFLKKDHRNRKKMEVACIYAGSKTNVSFCLKQLQTYYYKLNNRYLKVAL